MNASLRAEWLKLLTTRSFYWLTISAQECSRLDAWPAPGGSETTGTGRDRSNPGRSDW
jgi:hypothetical protein